MRRFSQVIDISYITHDCFHFSQKGHALGKWVINFKKLVFLCELSGANLLWNNLLQPIGLKSQKKLNYVLEKFECPKLNAPYLFTNKNTKNYFTNGFQ